MTLFGRSLACTVSCTGDSSVCFEHACFDGEDPALQPWLQCQTGAARCMGADLQTCNTGAPGWVTRQTCASPALCASGLVNLSCESPKCETGEAKCSGAADKTLLTCRADRAGWDEDECATEELCDSEAKTCLDPVCEPGDSECVGATLKVCNAGRTAMVTKDTCASPELCTAGLPNGSCAPKLCDAGEVDCVGADGATLSKCRPDLTGFDTEHCANAALCLLGKSSGACKPPCPDDRHCDPELASVIQVCKQDLTGYDPVTCTGAKPTCDPDTLQCGPTKSKLISVQVGSTTFSIEQHEVTVRQYQQFLAAPPAEVASAVGTPPQGCASHTDYAPNVACMALPTVCQTSQKDCQDQPQVCVDWCDANAYCRWIGRRLCGGVGGGPDGWTDYGSPDSSQWTAACVSGDAATHAFPYGSTASHQSCNDGSNGCTSGVNCGTVGVMSMSSCRGTTSPYDQIYDMSGNVAEWEDCCKLIDIQTQTIKCRMRGGSFYDDPDHDGSLRCTGAGNLDLADVGTNDADFIGFRCCKD